MSVNLKLLALLLLLLPGSSLWAHDTWVEAGPLLVRHGEYVYVNLMLGNHGNEHRDFRLASKITLAPCTLQVIGPDAQAIDLKPSLIDMGSAAKEGYWAARYQPTAPGMYEVVHTLDTLHGTIRAIKSAKTYLLVESGGAQAAAPTTQPAPHGHGLELMLATPLNELAAGRELKLQVLRSGKPLADARVSFVPRGVALSAGFDDSHERISDAQGVAEYIPANGNVYLAVVHFVAEDETGEDYTKTHYSAAMVLPIPNQPAAARSE
jgi:uncharacterized GH25 family protein